jgi:hypothetical protein
MGQNLPLCMCAAGRSEISPRRAEKGKAKWGRNGRLRGAMRGITFGGGADCSVVVGYQEDFR